MAVPGDNVIRFPEGVRGLTADFDRPQTLVRARDLMTQRLRVAFSSLLPQLEEELLTQGDVATGRAQRELFYGTRELIHDKALPLESFLAGEWLDLFEQRDRKSVV